MPAAGSRLLLDVPLALVIGAATWFSAQASRWFETAGGQWRGGPPTGRGWPDPGPVDLPPIWWLPLPFVLIMVSGLVVRRLFPRIAYGLVVVGVTAFLAVGGPYGPILAAPVVAVYSLASALPPERWARLTALLIPMLTAGFWTEPYLGLLNPQAYATVFFGLTVIMLSALIGLLRRNRRELDRAAREEELRAYAFEERLRVAREVHDVVGHSLSVINLQAGVALHVLDRRPEQVSDALTAIKRTSKEALDELRSTLEVFRDPDLRLAPGAGLERLPDLVGSLRAAGREVSLRDERSQPVPAAVDTAAFRIVQESLTNVVRHTDTATAVVTLQNPDDTLLVTVADDGSPVGTLTEGNGIIGMRERARSVGGGLWLDVGGPGVTVRAELPTDGRAEPA